MGVQQSTETSPIEKFPNNIKKSNFIQSLTFQYELSQQFQNYMLKQAEEVFVVQRKSNDDNTKYQRKQELIEVINKLKDFQEEKGQTHYKDDLERYFKQVNADDKIRKIMDCARESFISERNSVKNKPIHDYVSNKFNKFNGNNEKTDEWGFKYSISDSLCLTLPAVFEYDQENSSYRLKGKLTNQFSEFNQMKELESQLSHLITYFSDKLKITHDCFKNAQYADQLFYDTKKNVQFDNEIRAQVQIFEMELSPNQEYNGVLHKEGHSVEGILYSCLYIPQQDEGLDEGELRFYRLFEESEYNIQHLRKYMHKIGHIETNKKQGLQNNNMYLPLGHIKLQEDLMIIFPNRNLHKVVIKNTTDKVQKRLVIQFSVVNHIDQPFSINDLDINYHHNDELNDISYEIKKLSKNYKYTQKNYDRLGDIYERATFVN